MADKGDGVRPEPVAGAITKPEAESVGEDVETRFKLDEYVIIESNDDGDVIDNAQEEKVKKEGSASTVEENDTNFGTEQLIQKEKDDNTENGIEDSSAQTMAADNKAFARDSEMNGKKKDHVAVEMGNLGKDDIDDILIHPKDYQMSDDEDEVVAKEPQNDQFNAFKCIVLFFVIVVAVGGVLFAIIYTNAKRNRKVTDVIVDGSITATQTFNMDFKDMESALYKSTAKGFTDGVKKSFMGSKYQDNYNKTVVRGFRNGSIIIDFTLYLNGVDEQTDAALTKDISGVIVAGIDNGNYGDLVLDKNSLTATVVDATAPQTGITTTISPASSLIKDSTASSSLTAPAYTESFNMATGELITIIYETDFIIQEKEKPDDPLSTEVTLTDEAEDGRILNSTGAAPVLKIMSSIDPLTTIIKDA